MALSTCCQRPLPDLWRQNVIDVVINTGILLRGPLHKNIHHLECDEQPEPHPLYDEQVSLPHNF